MRTAFDHLSVLVIEDEPFTRSVTIRVLEGLGCAPVFGAGDGESGLQLASEHPIDLVLCDLEMQPLSGLDVLRRLRAAPARHLQALPVLFVTARFDSEHLAQASGLGNAAFLAKPIHPQRLHAALIRWYPQTPAAPSSIP